MWTWTQWMGHGGWVVTTNEVQPPRSSRSPTPAAEAMGSATFLPWYVSNWELGCAN